jgi:putative sterol carrier protein
MADKPAADLAAMIEGRTDREINNLVSSQGVDKVLVDIFNGRAAAFDPGAAGNQSAVIQFEVIAPDGRHSYQLNVANGKCNVATGYKEAAHITFALELPDFLRLVCGKLDEVQAVMSGKLRVSGDAQFAQTIQTWFKRQVKSLSFSL